MSRGGLTQSRPTEDATFVVGASGAIFAEDLAVLFGGGPQALRWSLLLLGILPRITTWFVGQYRNYWPAFRRAPRAGRHSAGAAG